MELNNAEKGKTNMNFKQNIFFQQKILFNRFFVANYQTKLFKNSVEFEKNITNIG